MAGVIRVVVRGSQDQEARLDRLSDEHHLISRFGVKREPEPEPPLSTKDR